MESYAGEEQPARASRRSLGRRFLPFVVLAVFSVAGFLLYRTLSRYSLDQIVASVTAIAPVRLVLAGGFAAASYLCLTGFDYLALRYVDRPLCYRRVALASFVSLSIGHNIGLAALSSGAIRYRFYSRWGVTPGEVAKLILFCAATVGLGLIILGGFAFLLRPQLAQEMTGLGRSVIMGLAAACLAVPMIYLGLAATLRQPLRLGSWVLAMPRLPLAIGQIIIGPLNFAAVAASLYQALVAIGDVAYLEVASVYVTANVATLITHIPGGLGVIESVILFLLPHADFIGAVLVFRFVYFLVPLGLGSITFALTELAYGVGRATPRGAQAPKANTIDG